MRYHCEDSTSCALLWRRSLMHACQSALLSIVVWFLQLRLSAALLAQPETQRQWQHYIQSSGDRAGRWSKRARRAWLRGTESISVLC